ncbi:S-adenosyl-l-methionine hydroxide adenosyltransferase family protein [Flavitalea sp. BT771]|uniref:SAM hydrolase/SAM-dependent halogenase family protein n=1 Tax=Flavitalea sp. BT771 TaxID=3063329 RepID=UPI0026E149C3|nr:S-adenosyl-l-methionine hydroxide adenosyltransferase family protein [Flavitalea sp. BT771]MDO6435009.1 S-adenosyl-l-methionine hydroxide adenosyltransferase family protein [Flavitalea sp. BT771]MDV6223909.1 S-adenosyl-l-methionine hydroxide adenosyltransferase family protein [Flavitalea sp. BT771]
MRKFISVMLLPVVLIFWAVRVEAQSKVVVFQSDFGLKDGAVSEMKGVAMGVSPDLKLFDLTHEIPAYNIWEASYRLRQTVPYWPSGTVFVSVVDPGVGTDRKSVVLRTRTGQFIVTPDNGTLTLVAEALGIGEIREINEAVNRRRDSQKSYTFHGRDVYAYTAARLAAGAITFEEVGPLLAKQEVVSIPYQKAELNGKVIRGTIPVLDVQYGNIWTNIPDDLFKQLHVAFGELMSVKIFHNGQMVYQGDMPYSATFGAVAVGKPLVYLNSLLQLSFALNQGSFAEVNKIASGNEWSVEVTKK